jgi:hypothetical protein
LSGMRYSRASARIGQQEILFSVPSEDFYLSIWGFRGNPRRAGDTNSLANKCNRAISDIADLPSVARRSKNNSRGRSLFAPLLAGLLIDVRSLERGFIPRRNPWHTSLLVNEVSQFRTLGTGRSRQDPARNGEQDLASAESRLDS